MSRSHTPKAVSASRMEARISIIVLVMFIYALSMMRCAGHKSAAPAPGNSSLDRGAGGVFVVTDSSKKGANKTAFPLLTV